MAARIGWRGIRWSSIRWSGVGRTLALASVVGTVGFLAEAKEPGDASRKDEAERLVAEGLHFGALGETAMREKLLTRALELDPNCEAARWGLGQVRQGDEWIDAEARAARLSDDDRLEAYRHRRDQAADTIEGQFELATWCRERKLDDQARAHLNRVLQLDSNHAAARQALGHRRVDGRWVSPEAVADANDRATDDLLDFRRFESTVRRLAERLGSESEAVREQASADLRQFDDPAIAVAIEAILFSRNENAALEAVRALKRLKDLRATEALARQSLVSPWESVREAAAEGLRDRPATDFVPSLLAEFIMPVGVQVAAVPVAPNRLVYREVLTSETQDQCRCVVRDTALRRLAMPGGQAEQTAARMVDDMMGSNVSTRRQAAIANVSIADRNVVIAQALRTATEEDLENDPRTWWTWWNEQSGIVVSEKPVEVDYQVQERTYVDQTSTGTAPSGSSQPTPSAPPMPQDCLAAGTLVLTDRGELPIEQVRVGDLVLSQEITSGRIEFRSVLRTTLREPSPLVEIRVGDELIRCSEGHPFWVAGEGWRQARELEAGMMLHGERRTLPIVEVRRDGVEPTYNLIVDGFATYFVGAERLLGHDATSRRPARELAPGLAP